jgi:hypothetical protein
LLSTLATAVIGTAVSNTQLALSQTPVTEGRSRTARRPIGTALGGSTRTMEPPPRQIDGAVPVVKVVEEKGAARLS